MWSRPATISLRLSRSWTSPWANREDSMQVKNRHMRRYYALAAIIIIGLVGVKLRNGGADAPIIRTASVEQGTVTATVSANCVLQPLRTVQVKSNVAGQIVKLAVDEG